MCWRNSGFYGLCGVRALTLFLFIFLYGLLMCLTKGQTLINSGVGQLVTTFFYGPSSQAFSLSICDLYALSIRGRECEFSCKETHQQAMHQLTYHNSEHTDPTVHASAVRQKQKGPPAESTVIQQNSSVNFTLQHRTHTYICMLTIMVQ